MRDGAEMRQRLALVGLINHARQHHQPIDPGLFGIARKAAGERRGVFGNAGQHRDAPARSLLHLADDLQLFRVLERGVLADRTQQTTPWMPASIIAFKCLEVAARSRD